jgi:hypothetical protein
LSDYQSFISPRELFFLIVRNININVVRIATGVAQKEERANVNEIYGRLTQYLVKSNEFLVQKILPNTEKVKYPKETPQQVFDISKTE